MRPIKAKPRVCLATEDYRPVILIVNSMTLPTWNEKATGRIPCSLNVMEVHLCGVSFLQCGKLGSGTVSAVA